MKKIVILTGDEYRHTYFRKKVACHPSIEVLASYCEGVEKSLENRTLQNPDASELERMHVDSRTAAELESFGEAIEFLPDHSSPVKIKKGAINDARIVQEITALQADILICYGSSIIKSALLDAYEGRFLNVHLGLSPYYRGSGTNIWALINNEPHMYGATYMHINKGIDTGEIIHQIGADILLGDGPHAIGNRLIRRMTDTYCDLIVHFDDLTKEVQPDDDGKLYLRKDFTAEACSTLYQNFRNGMVEDYLFGKRDYRQRILVKNRGLEGKI